MSNDNIVKSIPNKYKIYSMIIFNLRGLKIKEYTFEHKSRDVSIEHEKFQLNLLKSFYDI